LRLRKTFARRFVQPYQYLELARTAKLSAEELDAHLWRLYTNVFKQRDDGRVDKFPLPYLASLAGRCKAEIEFIQTLKKKRWIVAGRLSFWTQVFGKSLRRRYSRRRPRLERIWGIHRRKYADTLQTLSRHLADTLQTPSREKQTGSAETGVEVGGEALLPLAFFPPDPLSSPSLSVKPSLSPEEGGGDQNHATRARATKDKGPAAAGAKWEIPEEIRGLTLFENDARLCRNFTELVATWKQSHPTIAPNLTEHLRNAHGKLHSMIIAGDRKRPACLNYLTSWLANEERDSRKTEGAHAKSTKVQPAATKHVPGQFERWSR
jgi:hypothetical protein